MWKTRLWIPASAIVLDTLLLYCAVVSSLTGDRKILPLSWLGTGLKNLGCGSSLGFRFSQAESGRGGSIIFPSLLLFCSPPFPAT